MPNTPTPEPKRRFISRSTRKKKLQAENFPRPAQPSKQRAAEKNKPLVIPDNVRILQRFEDAKCATEGCTNKAVGGVDMCRRHGGISLIRGNLVPSSILPTALLGTVYRNDIHPMWFIRLAKEGMSEVEIAAEIEVSVGTMRDWADKFTEFNTAYEVGQALHESWWIQEAKENLDNRSYNVGLFKFITGNKLGYSEKTESKNLHVHAGVLQVPAKVTEAEWEVTYADKDAKGKGKKKIEE